MRRLRTTSTRRLWAMLAAVAALAVSGGIAQAALSGADTPPPKPLDRAVHDALRAPDVAGIAARIEFTNALLPGGSLPQGSVSPLAEGAEGRLWLTQDGRFRLELQSDAGDAQITSDGRRITVYDSASDTAYVLPAAGGEEQSEHDQPMTLAAVRRALDRVAEAWTLSGAQPTTTADRPSYTVRFAPKDDGSLLGAAELAWDAANGTPLRAAIYAQGDSEPVLELKATDISFGRVADSDVSTKPPAGAEIVEVDPATGHDGRPLDVHGVEQVQRRLDFRLAAPAELAGLPRRDVELVKVDGAYGALATYGKGLGAIVAFQQKADGDDSGSIGNIELPRVNIDGATGTELATALGTVVTFDRDGVAYTIAGSVPPVAAENAARDLR
jgi:outer membrane lipoprotein-sorting protein